MTVPALDRRSLEEDAWQRRDTEATWEQEEETRHAATAYAHTRVLLSRARLRAETYLQRN